MRDLIVMAFTFGSALLGLTRPWMGVLALAILAYLNPHRYAWGFSRSFPVYYIVFIATAAGIFLNSRDRQPFPWTRETGLFLLLLAWFTLTTLLFPDVPSAAKDQWIKVMKIYIGIFPTFWLINSKERLRWLVITIALSFGLVGLKGGVFALGTGFNYRVWGPDNTFYGGNNEIALALNMMLPLFLLCAKEAKRMPIKYFFYAVFFFSVCSILSSWSRGALITLCAVLGSIVLTTKRKYLAIPILIVGVFFFLPKLPDEWFTRMDTIQIYEEDASIQGRFRAWDYAIHRASESPLTGGGFETFIVGWGPDAHSAYFEILGEHGFVALGLWLSLLFGTMVALQRLRKHALQVECFSWVRDYARAIQIALLGYAVGGAFLGVAYWDIFYHMVALCVVMKVLLRKSMQEAQQTKEIDPNGVPAPA